MDSCNFSISVNNKKIIYGTEKETLKGKRKCSVESIEADDLLKGSDTCSVVINDPDYDFISDNIFVEQATITIKIIYTGESIVTKTFSGYISAIDVTFPEIGVPQITLTCMDHSQKMNLKTKNRTFKKKTRPQVVKKIAKSYGFATSIQKGYKFKKIGSIAQSDVTDIEFCENMADEESKMFYCKLKKNSKGKWCIYYRRLTMAKKPKSTLYYRSEPFDIINYSPQINVDSTSSSSSSSSGGKWVSTKVLNGKKKKGVRFTAYSIGGGGSKDMNNHPLKYGQGTASCDFISKYGTKIQVFIKGNKTWNKKVLTIRDTGVGRKDTVDILMPPSQAKNFLEHGYIIIGDGTGFKKKWVADSSGDTSMSAKQKKIVAQAEKYLYANSKYMYGNSYSFNHRNPWDCSSFVYMCFLKAVGRKLGTTTYTQKNNGKAVAHNVKSIKAGDIILWSNAYGHPGHVGLIAKKSGSKFLIYQNSPHKGVHKSWASLNELLTNYGSSTCYNIRRVL
jgi:cell wall-associated NlpC family hydrolase